MQDRLKDLSKLLKYFESFIFYKLYFQGKGNKGNLNRSKEVSTISEVAESKDNFEIIDQEQEIEKNHDNKILDEDDREENPLIEYKYNFKQAFKKVFKS